MSWLKQARIQQGYTQDKLSKAVGISQNYYSMLENGKRGSAIRSRLAKKLANVLNIEWTRFYD